MWIVRLHPDFDAELVGMPREVQTAISVAAQLIGRDGPFLGRPHADTLKGSRVPNLKEYRFSIKGVPWRLAYVFDPRRNAIFLVAGSKSGVNKSLFYKRFIKLAEQRFLSHIIVGDGL